MVRVVGLGSAFVCLVISVQVLAQSAPTRLPIAIGDTGAVVGGAPAAAALEEALEAALEDREDLRVSDASHARFVVTASVTELSERDSGAEREVRCAVSVVVADRGGSVRAMLAGRAGARGEDEAGVLAERALLAAVRGALRPLGGTLR